MTSTAAPSDGAHASAMANATSATEALMTATAVQDGRRPARPGRAGSIAHRAVRNATARAGRRLRAALRAPPRPRARDEHRDLGGVASILLAERLPQCALLE